MLFSHIAHKSYPICRYNGGRTSAQPGPLPFTKLHELTNLFVIILTKERSAIVRAFFRSRRVGFSLSPLQRQKHKIQNPKTQKKMLE